MEKSSSTRTGTLPRGLSARYESADSYLALNPRGKVPVLVDEDFSIYESSVILEYLEDKYPDVCANLFPQDIQSRTLSRRLINEIDCYLWPEITINFIDQPSTKCAGLNVLRE